jgi:phage tail sheath protein FI
MALKPSESPAISIKEIDLSSVVPAVTSSTGAIVGDFAWGPGNQPVRIGNEAELATNFGSPEIGGNDTDFLSASYFLKYSSNAFVVRSLADSDRNAVAAGTAVKVDNNEVFQTGTYTTQQILAKYPGTAGNSLKVEVCPNGAIADSAFDGWGFKSNFDAAPGTSSYVSARGDGVKDEVHVAVIDSDGLFSGAKGTVLETFPFVSLATDARTDDGTSNYILDVLNDRSSYVYGGSVSTQFTGVATSAEFAAPGSNAVANYSLGNAVSATQNVGDYTTGFDQFEDENTTQVDFLIAPQFASQEDQVTMVADLAGTAASRKDCVVVSSPHRAGIVGVNNATTVTTNTKAFADAVSGSSYVILDGNFLKVYNKYKDEYVYIPAASSTAGLMAATDAVSAPWFSPAGQRRGLYFGASTLAWNPTKSQRDTLYKAGVNPIVNLPGQGIVLFGDKTKQSRPSAFDRINVRRLFLVIERAIKGAAQNVMFEFNDEFTRAEFVNVVEPFLREIKGRRGISDFRVVCDETNNTPDIIDNNSFVASVFVKPARSINYVTLNFVAVRTGVDFDEVVGLA